MTKRAAIYCRVSTKRQADSDISIPDQLNQCRAWCEAEGIEVAAEFIEPGASARSDDRPVFQDMIAQASSPEGPFDTIIISSIFSLIFVGGSIVWNRQVHVDGKWHFFY